MQSITLINWILFAGSALLVAGILSSLVAQRFGAPLLLVFLGIGMLIGEDGPGGVAFSDFSVTYLIGSFALAIILFDGGLRTRLSAFEGVIAPSAVLASVGVLFTALIIALLAMPVLNLSFPEALLIGSMIAPTDAAAVFFLLRAGGLHLHRRVGATLEVESGTNDPVAVLLTIVLVEYLAEAGGASGAVIIGTLIWHGVLGGLVGLAGGYALVWLLNRVELPAGLHPLLAVACAVTIFALAQVLHSSGFLAVYVAGLVVGNRRVRAFASIISFHDAATWLVQILMFVVLGLLVTPSNLVTVIVPGVIISLFLMLIARPIAVFLSLQPFRFSVNERIFVSWVGLRGAVSIFLAAIPTLAGLPHGDLYFNIAFIVVVISLIVQGWTLTPLARRLGLALPQGRADVSRVEIDLPGQQEHEMVGYYIEAGSTVVLSPGASPRWARPVFVVRDDHILEPGVAGGLKPGDYGYFLAPPERVRELDRIFAVAADTGEHANFPLRSGVQLGVLSDLYGLDVEEELRDRTVAEHFDTEMDDEPVAGDKLSFGPAMLVVRGVKDGRVSEAELELSTGTADEPPVEPDRFDRLLRRARTGMRKLEARLFNRR
jgi:cell volume regulation protein A